MAEEFNEEKMEELKREALKHGGVLARFYFDLHADNPELLKQLAVSLVQKFIEEEGVVCAKGEVDEVVENEDGFHSTYVEIELCTDTFADLVRLASDYSPISAEILEPEEISLSFGEAQSLLMDVSIHSHQLKKTLMEKTYTKEDWEKMKKLLEYRAKVGEELMKKKKEE